MNNYHYNIVPLKFTLRICTIKDGQTSAHPQAFDVQIRQFL